MSGVGDFFEDIAEGIVDFAGDVINTVVDFVQDSFKSIETTVKNIINDPLPTILMIAGQAVGIPPYVTASVITAAKGGDLEDIAKAAAVSFAATEVMTGTDIGQEISAYTKSIGVDVTQSMIEDFNLPTDLAASIGKASTASLNSAIIGGVRAGLTGQDVMDGITSGLASGAIYSGTDSYFKDLNADWGLSDKTLNLIKGSTSSALNALVLGKDPAAAVGNFIAYATIKSEGTDIAKQAKQAFSEFKTAAEDAEKKQTAYEEVKAKYDSKVTEYKDLQSTTQAKVDEYNKILNDQYNPFKNQYDSQYKTLQAEIDSYNLKVEEYQKYKDAGDATNANKAAEVANTLAEAIDLGSKQLQTLVETNQPIFDKLKVISDEVAQNQTKLESILVDIETPTGSNLASQLKTAADNFQKSYDLYKSTEASAQTASEKYITEVAEIATRDALIDSLNNGVLFPTSIDEQGNYILNNGLKLATDGRFYEGDKQLFSNASGIDQKAINFTDYKGEMVSFGEDAGRNLSKTDVEHIFENNYGVQADQATIDKLAGKDFNVTREDFQAFAEKQVNQQYQDILGRNATAEELKYAIRPMGDSIDVARDQASRKYVDDVFSKLPEYQDEWARYFYQNDYEAALEAVKTGDFGKVKDIAADITSAWTTDSEAKQIIKDAYKAVGIDWEPTASQIEAIKGKPETEAYKFAEQASTEASIAKGEEQKAADLAKAEKERLDALVKTAGGEFDAGNISLAKAKLIEDIKSQYSNPADLSKSEMLSFVDNYTKATPEQRAQLLKGVDSATYKVINDYLQTYTGKASETDYKRPEVIGSISASDYTNYANVPKAALISFGSDILSLGTKAASLIGDAMGYDTATISKIQDVIEKNKDAELRSLVGEVGNERIVAGGIGSGLTSILSYAATGPIGMIATLAGVTANNSWYEGSQAVIDSQGNSWKDEEEAKKNGVWTYRHLTDEENAKRTAAMTALEIVMEAAGAKGFSLLAKQIPITGNVNEIIDAVKTFGKGMLSEQLTEALTTSAQMAVDKVASFGLQQNATLDDYVRALGDTALATAAGVGTATSTSNLAQSIRNASTIAPSFSLDTRETVEPTLPSLANVLKDSGVSDDQINSLVSNIKSTISGGGVGIDEIKSTTTQALKDLGITSIRSENLADEMVSRVLDQSITDTLSSSGLSPDQINLVLEPIKTSLESQVGPSTFVSTIDKTLRDSGLDESTALNVANQFSSANVVAQDEARKMLADQGYTNPSDADVARITGLILETKAQQEAASIAGPNVVTAQELKDAAAAEGFILTDEQARDLARQGNEAEIIAQYRAQIDPLAVTREEAQKFFDEFGYPPSVDELNRFIASKPEAETRLSIGEYVAPHQVTLTEAQKIFEDLGYKLSPDEVNQFVKSGQDIQQEQIAADIKKYVDPRMVTTQEVLDAYHALGIDQPTTQDVTKYVGQLNQEDVLKDIAANADTARYNALQEKVAQQAQAAKQQSLAQKGLEFLGQTGAAAPVVAAASQAPQFLKPFITSATKQEGFESALQPFLKEVAQTDYTKPEFGSEMQQTAEVRDNTQQGETVMPSYFTYGNQSDIDRLFTPFSTAGTGFFPETESAAGGLATPLMAAGGSTRYGRYAGGGLPVVEHSGKARLDFRSGAAVTGPGDGQSDDIPAMLADGEFVIPADVVAALGNGSTKAGSDKLYDMMHSIRSYHRAAKPQDLPPQAKMNPLDYLKRPAKRARR